VNVFEYMNQNRGEVLELTLQHLGMVAMALLLAVLIGIPLGILLTRRRSLRQWVLGAANVIQTVPSLALFGFLIPVPLLGVSPRTAIVALTLYALLPIIRNTYVGIAQVEPAVIEVARGMGMTGGQILWLVEVPLSLPVILAGIRLATVIAIGTATIAAAIGAGGLGEYIYRGVAGPKNYLLLAGALPAALMAVIADASLGWAEHRLRSR